MGHFCERTCTLSMKGITKIYGNGILANDKVDFGECRRDPRADGENGAGKSTLMKMIFGIEHPDEGEIYCRGPKGGDQFPTDALKLGIGMVHQHFMLVPSHPRWRRIWSCAASPEKACFWTWKRRVAETEAISQKYNLLHRRRARVSDLAVG